jgi:hypothetical protein
MTRKEQQCQIMSGSCMEKRFAIESDDVRDEED